MFLALIMTFSIEDIIPRKIINSRADWTIEVDFITENGVIRSSVPSGKSIGSKEARFFDLDESINFIVKHKNDIIDKIKNMGSNSLEENLKEFDSFILSKVSNASVSLPLSMNLFKLLKKESDSKINKNLKLFFNVLNGGEHSGNLFSCQEIMISFPKMDPIKQIEAATVVYKKLKEIIAEKYGKIYSGCVADEGGFSPLIKFLSEGLNLVINAATLAGYKNQFLISLDLAANSYFKNNIYNFDNMNLNTSEID